ncbi:MAG: UDP-3-O-(3-hydroxymyristoyl)glucosamine N-acyltransferase [Casimicrobiaceae bacterium]
MRRAVSRPMTAGELVEHLRALDSRGRLVPKLEGDPTTKIERVATPEAADTGDLAFVIESRRLEHVRSRPAAVLIMADGSGDWAASARLIHAKPRLIFAHALDLLNPPPAFVASISPSAQVAADAIVDGARVDALAVVGAGARVGAGSTICSGAVIGQNCRIGRDCLIHSNATIADGVVLGDRVIIHSGAVIGADGFGFEHDGTRWVKIQQLGSVLIGNDVEIGASSTIDRGAIEDTVIGDGVKIDDQVHIAHNCVVGDGTIIAGCVGVAGSTRIGRNCRIGGAAMIVGHISICDGAVVSGGTLIAASIDRPGQYTGVFPSTDHATWMRIAAGLRRSGRR